ncbi:MAG: Minf_1886 family protein [Thermoguttaceae bacterium]
MDAETRKMIALADEDPRFSLETYQFVDAVFQALSSPEVAFLSMELLGRVDPMDEDDLQRMRDETANPVDDDEIDEYSDAAEGEDEEETYGQDYDSQDFSTDPFAVNDEDESVADEQDDDAENDDSNGVTAEQVCVVAVEFAVRAYGLMARTILARLGLRTTGDLGDVVYKMIDAGLIYPSEGESRSDFDDVFDLGEELDRRFKFHYKKRSGSSR